MKNVTRMKFGALVIVGALFGAACSDSDNDLDEARAVLEEATEALANAEQARVDAALAAGVFHRGELPIMQLKAFLGERGIEVRP